MTEQIEKMIFVRKQQFFVYKKCHSSWWNKQWESGTQQGPCIKATQIMRLRH